MWKELEIAKQLFFLRCTVVEEQVICLLCDFSTANEYFCETLKVEDLVKRSKQLNKRIKYDEATICETIQRSVPMEAWFNSSPNNNGDSGDSGLELKVVSLKYRIESMPFKIEWHLRKIEDEEFHKQILKPLFSAVYGMSQQIAELLDVVRKKDVEIMQYRAEGNTLRRTTVVTKPFNFLQFDEKFAETLELARSFGKVAGYMQMNNIDTEDTTAATIVPLAVEDKEIKTEEPKSSKINSPKKSPKNRKRNALQAQRLHLERKIAARQKQLEYFSSQSQSQSDECESLSDVSLAPKRRHMQRQTQPPPMKNVRGNSQEAKVHNAQQQENETVTDQQPITVLPMQRSLTPPPTATTASNLPSYNTSSSSSSSVEFKTPATPPELLEDEGGSQTILSIGEMNEKLDVILKELKQLEEQRIADMKKRLGGNFD